MCSFKEYTRRPPTQPLTLSIACCKHMHDYMRGFHPTGLDLKVKVHKKWDLWTKRRQEQHRQNMETNTQKNKRGKLIKWTNDKTS